MVLDVKLCFFLTCFSHRLLGALCLQRLGLSYGVVATKRSVVIPGLLKPEEFK